MTTPKCPTCRNGMARIGDDPWFCLLCPDDDAQARKLGLAKLRAAFDDAVALLRDWEDYDPADPECGWLERRDEFLAEHEEAGR
jgi:hypothetical protein